MENRMNQPPVENDARPVAADPGAGREPLSPRGQGPDCRPGSVRPARHRGRRFGPDHADRIAAAVEHNLRTADHLVVPADTAVFPRASASSCRCWWPVSSPPAGWRRELKYRVGSLSVDQFGSVVAVLAVAFFFLQLVNEFTIGALVTFIGALVLVASTTLAPHIPPFSRGVR